MWIVAKYKPKQLNFFKDNLNKSMGEKVVFFNPKIKRQNVKFSKLKLTEKLLLDKYIICFNKNFNNSSVLKRINNIKGLDYFLSGSQFNQKEIISFVNYCQSHEDKEGFIMQSFFNFRKITKGQFISGTFTNFVFDVIENQKNRLKVLVGNAEICLKKNSEYLFQPI